jgi:hypothetical protein
MCFLFYEDDKLKVKSNENKITTIIDEDIWENEIQKERGFSIIHNYDPELVLDVSLMSTSLIRERLASLSSLEAKGKNIKKKAKTKKEVSFSLLEQALKKLEEKKKIEKFTL